MQCVICEHPQRAAIENAVLSCSSDKGSKTLRMIADEYGVSLNALKIHILMHASLGFVPSSASSSNSGSNGAATEAVDNEVADEELQFEPVETLARKCKLREADMLSEVANEYLVTLKNLGRRINYHLSSPAEKAQAEKLLTKPITDMYLGLGGEIRATVKTISDLDQILHGPKNDGASGLATLAAVLQQSQQLAQPQPYVPYTPTIGPTDPVNPIEITCDTGGVQ